MCLRPFGANVRMGGCDGCPTSLRRVVTDVGSKSGRLDHDKLQVLIIDHVDHSQEDCKRLIRKLVIHRLRSGGSESGLPLLRASRSLTLLAVEEEDLDVYAENPEFQQLMDS